MDPFYLGIFVMVGVNKTKFKPTLQAIKERYFQKFRGKGGEGIDEHQSGYVPLRMGFTVNGWGNAYS